MGKFMKNFSKNYILGLAILGIASASLFSQSSKSSFSNVPLKYGEDYVKYNMKSAEIAHDYLLKISQKCIINKNITNEDDIDYVDLVKCILLKLNKQSYDKFLNNEYTEHQALLLITILLIVLHDTTTELAKKNHIEVNQEDFLNKLAEKEKKLFDYFNLDFDDPEKEIYYKKIMGEINDTLDKYHEYFIQ